MRSIRVLLLLSMTFILANCGSPEASQIAVEDLNDTLGQSGDSSFVGFERALFNDGNMQAVGSQVTSSSDLDDVAMDWDGKHRDSDKWTKYATTAVETYGENLIKTRPRDITSFCPNYDRLNEEGQKMFWVHLLSVMTRYESSFKPETKYTEAFHDNNGDRIISRGLLQLSIESGKGYGCDLSYAQQLHQPQKNLQCGVKILDLWVKRDKVLSEYSGGKWRGGGRYWAVLRSSRGLVQKIKARTVKSELCAM